MRFMNEYEIERAVDQFNTPETPNLARAVTVLSNLMEWTNRNSDGWPYWAKPVRSANRLMELVETGQRRERDYFDEPVDVTAAEVRKALVPIKSFLTRQGVDHGEVL